MDCAKRVKENLIFFDVDAFLINKIDEIFEDSFDIGITIRSKEYIERKEKLGLNYSLIPNSKTYSSEYIKYLNHNKKLKMIYLDRMITLIKTNLTKNIFISNVITKLLNYIHFSDSKNKKFMKRIYYRIRVPLFIYYFFQFL